MFCCDLSRRDAFDRRHDWLSNIRRDAPASCVIGIIGTQSDKSSTCVTENDLKSFCENENLAFWIACSARENKNIRELFVVAVEKAQQRYQQAKELSDGINAKTSSEGEQSAHQLSVADCMMGQVPARECPGIMSHSSASVTSSPMASMPNLQLLFFNHTKMNGLTENLNKVTQTPVTPPSLPLLYESYKMHGGSWRAALSIFGIFDYRSRDEIYAALKERSVSGGASFKTRQQFNLT